ncbi:N-acetyltransferase [Arthrobacter oryzae]|uniref:N-acetyltransferase n=1 Tax=Arthrobacter oryzae TaxID=409290 RepID=A0A3N0BKD4_9MICC|nr:N-acetyltransferase [Arthrobacter oryzae]
MSEGPWTSPAAHAVGFELVRLPLPVLAALADGNLDAARAATPLGLTPYLVSAECVGVWRIRRDQIASSPDDAAWVTRLVLERASGRVVGRAGYHGPPDGNGMVEVGYSIDPAQRRRGYARGSLVILLDVAKAHPDVRIVRATVSPGNLPSRALLDQYGFQPVGEQWDDEDGLEIILELPCP